jgi:hypothetical protein
MGAIRATWTIQGNETQVGLKEVTTHFVGGGLEIVLTVVRPAGGGWAVGMHRRNTPADDSSEGKGSVSDVQLRACRRHRISAGETGMGAEEWPGERPDGSSGSCGMAATGRADRELDLRPADATMIRSQGGQERHEWVRCVPVEWILELRITAQWKNIRP